MLEQSPLKHIPNIVQKDYNSDTQPRNLYLFNGVLFPVWKLHNSFLCPLREQMLFWWWCSHLSYFPLSTSIIDFHHVSSILLQQIFYDVSWKLIPKLVSFSGHFSLPRLLIPSLEIFYFNVWSIFHNFRNIYFKLI